MKLNFKPQNMQMRLKHELLFISLAIVAGFIFTFGYFTKCYAERIQTGISNEVIRFHVLANSDSPEDQALKLLVRDGILEELYGELSGTENIGETRDLLSANLDVVKGCAERIVSENGYDYDIDVYMTRDMFPTKTYGDVTFPAGTYEALRVELGEGGGKNWWCVMFPPLCYVDVTQGTVSDEAKTDLKNILAEDEYLLVSTASTTKDVSVKIRFKIVEWWQSLTSSKKAI